MMKRLAAVPLAVFAFVLAFVLLAAAPASAHPLGNFSVNQYLGLTLRPDRVDATAVVDFAEIPTLQDSAGVDADSDGMVSDAERAAHADTICAQMAAAVDGQVGRDALVWTVARSEFFYSPGAGGLEVSRLGCSLTAPAALDGPTQLRVDNRYLANRVGWREMTATGAGVALVDSALPSASVTDELRAYPQDLLTSALDVRSVSVRVEPGADARAGSPGVITGGADPVSRWMAAVDRRFQDLAGGPHLTPVVAVLAVLLALLLGAGHAALPGHGKTVLAAYLAGKRGHPRDALTVAGTVTLTHTGSVLVLGLLLTVGTALVGEEILAWLGLTSGALVLVVGVAMLAGVLRRRAHHHDHDDHDDHHVHEHRHEHHEHHEHRPRRTGPLGMAGIGLAGGLVPSPSALVVLLAAIGLGRTGFGVVLVAAYGVGMAATLTGAGLLLLALQRRLAARGRTGTRLSRLTARLNAATPAATAALVLLVGVGLAARAAAGVW